METLDMDGDNFLQKLDAENKRKFCEACLCKVFGYDEGKDEIVVERRYKCTFCEECLIATQELIKKKDKTDFNKLKEKKKRIRSE